jgi:hypothetical protein
MDGVVNCAYIAPEFENEPELGSIMTMDEQTPHEKKTHVDEKVTRKKPYKKPTFRFERVFETAALSCGKIAGTSNLCNSSRKTS